MWYSAHAVMAIRFKEGVQNEFPAWENIILIQAETDQEALDKAEARARQDEGECGLTWAGHPAEFVFSGLRKVVKCYESELQPSDGTELTYNQLVFSNKEDFDAFASGREAHALFENEDPINE